MWNVQLYLEFSNFIFMARSVFYYENMGLGGAFESKVSMSFLFIYVQYIFLYQDAGMSYAINVIEPFCLCSHDPKCMCPQCGLLPLNCENSNKIIKPIVLYIHILWNLVRRRISNGPPLRFEWYKKIKVTYCHSLNGALGGRRRLQWRHCIYCSPGLPLMPLINDNSLIDKKS